MNNLFSTKQAALKLGLSQAHIRRLLEGGQLSGYKLGHDWAVLNLDYKRKRKPKRNRNQLQVKLNRLISKLYAYE